MVDSRVTYHMADNSDFGGGGQMSILRPQILYSVYDGWNLIAEYSSGLVNSTTAYLPGIKNLTTDQYYYQDGLGSITHLADNNGQLLEWYRYDLQGKPRYFSSTNQPLPTSTAANRFLFTGQQWYSELGLYDLRNRFYSPDIGRFAQADPIGFAGDTGNLYRYAGNNSINATDPLGLQTAQDCDHGVGCGGGDGSSPSGNTRMNSEGDVINDTGPEGFPSPNKPGQPPAPPGSGIIGAITGTGNGGNGNTNGGATTAAGGSGPGGGSGNGPGLGPGGLGSGSGSGPGGAPSGGALSLYVSGGGTPGTVRGDGGGSGIVKSGARNGNPHVTTVGEVYDLSWINHELYNKYGRAHKTELESEYRFIRTIYYGATVYAVAPLVVAEGGPIAVSGIRASYTYAATHKATTAAVIYGVSILNSSAHPEEQQWLPEIIEEIAPWFTKH